MRDWLEYVQQFCYYFGNTHGLFYFCKDRSDQYRRFGDNRNSGIAMFLQTNSCPSTVQQNERA